MLCFNYFKTKNKIEKGGSVYIMFITDVKLGDDGGGEVDLWANGLDNRLGNLFFFNLFFSFFFKVLSYTGKISSFYKKQIHQGVILIDVPNR